LTGAASTHGQGISWVGYVLPFIEQLRLFDEISFSALDNWPPAATSASSDLNYSLARANRPDYLLCPSARITDTFECATPANPAYTSHHYGIMGVAVPSTLAATYPRYTSDGGVSAGNFPGTQGMFPGWRTTPSAVPLGVSGKDVTDGLSKTYLLGEISWAGMADVSRSATRSYLSGYNPAANAFIRSARNIYSPRPINISKNARTANIAVSAINSWNNLNWGSNHPGGTHFPDGRRLSRFRPRVDHHGCFHGGRHPKLW
jgi:hypothetical protein